MDIEKLKFPIGTFEKPEMISEKDLHLWIETIALFPEKLSSRTFSIEELNYKYRLQGWTIKQVIHHCADSHSTSFTRFKLALTEDLPTIKPYDEAKWSELVDGIDNDILSSLKIIEGVHYKWVLLLKSLDKVQLKKQFMHPESKKIYTLDEVIGLYAWHCNHHFAHIEQAILHKNKF
ncbi:YfiT family bacillithiol transferase [Flavobacterium sp.]|uniref:YfiT family bacillithiol transferase n=1 Tax=Flavobacterium sp. TaxID=239 RepID=UPI0037535543